MINDLTVMDVGDIGNKAKIHPFEFQIKTLETYQAMLLVDGIGILLN